MVVPGNSKEAGTFRLRLTSLIPRAIRKRVKRLVRRGDPSKERGVGKPRRRVAPGIPARLAGIGPVRLLSVAPPVFLSGMPYRQYLGIAHTFARRYGNTAAGFLLFPTWTIEHPGAAKSISQAIADHSARYPNHLFRVLCNTRTEARLLEDLGLRAVFLNKNIMVSDRIFRPIQGASVEFDAVYNARFVSMKRHELAAAIPRVGYLAYVEGDDGRREEFRALYAAALARNPGHALLNGLVDGLASPMSHEQVNATLARAAVGLVLSRLEGSSYASMEYLLAGLPVVSTPSKGGRDVFFDPEYCIVCEPDPAAVRDAVAELRSRNIPRELVRARTLAKIQPERQRFLAIADGLIEELGGKPRYRSGGWPFGDTSGVTWRPFEVHLAEFAAGLRTELAEELGLGLDALTDVQLEAAEIRPIVAAIRQRPGCSLLVFGCGNDSHFWEKANRGGTTVFLEDNPSWATAARAGLAAATVHAVRYDTSLSEWWSLLDRPSQLAMDLPSEIDSRRWDVILVDGPAGHADSQPGRMKSIYAASKLVAPGGRVFVHDCDRPAERAFASRYLGDDRLFIEAKGRAVLKGYAF